MSMMIAIAVTSVGALVACTSAQIAGIPTPSTPVRPPMVCQPAMPEDLGR